MRELTTDHRSRNDGISGGYWLYLLTKGSMGSVSIIFPRGDVLYHNPTSINV